MQHNLNRFILLVQSLYWKFSFLVVIHILSLLKVMLLTKLSYNTSRPYLSRKLGFYPLLTSGKHQSIFFKANVARAFHKSVPFKNANGSSKPNMLLGKKFSTSHLKMVKSLWNTMWPKNKPSFKIRVLIALMLLISSKILNVQVPFYFKSIVDEMNIDWPNNTGDLGIVLGSLILAYGGARFSAVLFGELRNAIFASVAHSAIKKSCL